MRLSHSAWCAHCSAVISASRLLLPNNANSPSSPRSTLSTTQSSLHAKVGIMCAEACTACEARSATGDCAASVMTITELARSRATSDQRATYHSFSSLARTRCPKSSGIFLIVTTAAAADSAHAELSASASVQNAAARFSESKETTGELHHSDSVPSVGSPRRSFSSWASHRPKSLATPDH